MSGTCIEKIPHSCGSGSGLQVFVQEDGTVDGWCFACSSYVRHPYGYAREAEDVMKDFKPKKSPEEIQEEINELLECTSGDLSSRGLKKKALETYGIRIGYSRVDGKKPEIVAFPYKSDKEDKIVAFKVRLLDEKKSFWVGSPKDVAAFGWYESLQPDEQGRKSNTLIVVEGEFDVPAAMTIMKRFGNKEYTSPQFISVPHGAGSAPKFIKKNIKKWKTYFKDVVLMLDNDKVGRKAIEDTIKMTGIQFQTIELPKKDANDCLMEGLGKVAHDCITFRKGKAKNSKIVWGESIHEEAKEPAQWGLSWPWQGMTDLTRGLRFGETYYIGAGVGYSPLI